MELVPEPLQRPLVFGLVDSEILPLIGEPEGFLDDRVLNWWSGFTELVAALASLDPCRRFLRLGTVEGQPVGLDALAGDTAAIDQPGFDVGLDLKGAATLVRRPRQGIEDRLPPGDVGLVDAGEVAQQADGRGVGQGVGRVGVVGVGADEVRLQHAVDGDQPGDGIRQIPDVLAEVGEIVGGRLGEERGRNGAAPGARRAESAAWAWS